LFWSAHNRPEVGAPHGEGLRRRLLVVAGVLVVLLAATATAGLLLVKPVQRVSVTITSPTQLVALRPNLWTFEIHNMGPGISDLGLRLTGADGWLTNHSIVYAGTGCRYEAQTDFVLCGSVQQGETRTISIAAAANAPGTHSYQVTFCDCGQNGQPAIAGPTAPQFAMPGSIAAPYVQTWTETVVSGPSVSVTVTDILGHPVSGATVTVLGSALSAITAATGVAQVALGPLGPGSYTVVATNPGSVSANAPITVPSVGDPPAATVVLASSAAALKGGSDPSVMPGAVLIVDEDNNRLIVISPQGQLLWVFPRPGDLSPGQTFVLPDDAFFSPDGTQIIATQEEDFAVTLIDVATHKIVWRYGEPGIHGSGPNQLWNPDDAMVMPNGDVLIADIVNCRIIVVAQGQHTIAHQYGVTGSCHHAPPSRFGSPNGAFPLADGNWLITEINGDWASELAPGGAVLWSTHPPAVAYPSDTNEVGPNRYLTVDYSYPGQVVMFDKAGNTLWRYRPLGAAALNHPSLALPLPNGDVILNDDYNDRVIVVDPKTNTVVWQYGVTGRRGSALGWLANPDGIDLAPPYSLLGQLAGSLKTL